MQSYHLQLKFPTNLLRVLSFFKIWVLYKSNFIAFWMHLHGCRCFQKYLGILFQSLKELCLASGRPRSMEPLLRPWGMSGRLPYGFWTDLHFDDVVLRIINSSNYYIAQFDAPNTLHCNLYLPLSMLVWAVHFLFQYSVTILEGLFYPGYTISGWLYRIFYFSPIYWTILVCMFIFTAVDVAAVCIRCITSWESCYDSTQPPSLY